MIYRATAHSLSGFGEAWNATHNKNNWARSHATRDEKPRKCRICGAEMEHIEGSNVYVCHGMIAEPSPTKEDPNAKILKPCTNFALGK